jgi:L-ribulose-5-phosphate 3-epimerase
MRRRGFLKSLGILFSSRSMAVGFANSKDPTSSPLNRFKLGAISDGFSLDFEEALTIMKSYGLSWVEIRQVFGVYNTEANPVQIRRLKDSLDKHGFRVSVIDSALYKCALPGTNPIKGEKEKFGYAKQMDLLKRAIDRAGELGTDKIRGFTFWRVAQPGDLSERLAEELGKAADLAHQSRMRLVIENEESCNAGTGRELADILKLAPASNLGVNWDVGNGYTQGEVSFPDGYHALDKKRIWHMHLKGMTCKSGLKECSETFANEGQIDLLGQFRQLLRDGYHETMSLECEFHSPGLSHLETSKRSMAGLLKVMASAVDGQGG